MSPVAPSTGHAGRALLVAAVSMVVLMAALYLAAVAYGHTDSPNIKLGDTTFHGGSTQRLSKAIAKGGPAFYSDVSGSHDRDIILQHLGPAVDKGWYAFRAQPPDKRRDCVWVWKAAEHLFRAKCDPTLTAPADGAGLERYPVTIRYSQIYVDLNADARPTTTTNTTPPSTTTTVPRSGTPKPTTTTG